MISNPKKAIKLEHNVCEWYLINDHLIKCIYTLR